MEPIELLKEIGLTKIQAKIYLQLLYLKKAKVMEIHRETKISRSNIYHNLKRLEKMELVKIIKEGKKRLFAPEPPKVLLKHFEEKEKIAKELIEELGDQSNNKIKKPIRIYNGYSKEAHKLIWKEITESYKKDCIEFGMYETWEKYNLGRLGVDEILKYLKERIKKNINFKTLLSEKDKKQLDLNTNRILIKTKLSSRNNKDESRILPDHLNFYIDIACVDDSVHLYGPYAENYISNIKSDSLSNFFSNIFYYIWSKSEEIKK